MDNKIIDINTVYYIINLMFSPTLLRKFTALQQSCGVSQYIADTTPPDSQIVDIGGGFFERFTDQQRAELRAKGVSVLNIDSAGDPDCLEDYLDELHNGDIPRAVRDFYAGRKLYGDNTLAVDVRELQDGLNDQRVVGVAPNVGSVVCSHSLDHVMKHSKSGVEQVLQSGLSRLADGGQMHVFTQTRARFAHDAQRSGTSVQHATKIQKTMRGLYDQLEQLVSEACSKHGADQNVSYTAAIFPTLLQKGKALDEADIVKMLQSGKLHAALLNSPPLTSSHNVAKGFFASRSFCERYCRVTKSSSEGEVDHADSIAKLDGRLAEVVSLYKQAQQQQKKKWKKKGKKK